MEEKSNDENDSKPPESQAPVGAKRRWLGDMFRRKNKNKITHKEAEASEAESAEESDVKELITDAAEMIGGAAAAVPKVLRKNRWVLLLTFRIFFYGFCVFVGLLLIAYTGIKIFVQPDDIKRIIKENVEFQTGGKIDIGAIKFDPLTGIQIFNVEFYAPEPGDARGMLEGGSIVPIPLANFEELNIGYNVQKMLAAQINIDAMQLVEPQIHLKLVDGTWNFQGILDYRNRKFPAKESVAETKSSESSLDGLFIVSPAVIYMPIQILAQNIGIKNLKLDLIEEINGRIAKVVVTNGLSFDVGAFWHKKNSNFWFSILSLFDSPFELDIKEAKRDEKGQVIGDLEQTLLINTALILRAELSDFMSIKFDFANRLTNLATPIAGYRDVGNFVKVRAKVADTLKAVDIASFEVELADALSYSLNGKIEIDSFALKAITLKLVQKFNLDIENTVSLATPFVKGIKGDGSVSFDSLKIEGVIEPEKLTNFDKGFALPYVSGVVWLENIWIDIPETGVSMQPISGDISLAAGPALNGTGSQADIAMNINVPKFSIEHKLKFGAVSAGVENLALNSTVRALWPEMLVPVLKMNMQAERVVAKGAGIAPVDVPLFFDLDAEGGKDLSRISANLSAELTDLAEFSLGMNCSDVCQRFRINTQSRLDSFEKLHSIIFPLGASLNLTDYMPTKMSGSLDFQFAARGTIPDPLTTAVPDLIKNLDVRFNSQVNLNKLSAQIPFFNTNLKGFDNRIAFNGSHLQQKIDITQKIDALTLTIESGETKKSVPVELSKYQIVSEITNEVTEPLDLERIKEIMNTSIELDIYFAKLSADGLIPMPIRELQLYIEGSQSKLVDISIDEVTLKIPNLGLDSLVKAEATLGTDYLPTKAKVDIKTNINHNGSEILPDGVKTSGGISVDLVIESPDLKTVSVVGETKFDRFFLTLPGLTEADSIVVEDIRGQIPFKQEINIPDTLVLIERLTAAPKVASSNAPSSGNVGQVPDAEKEVSVERIDLSGLDARKSGLDTAVTRFLSKQNSTAQKDANRIAMVDYGAVRPYFPNRQPLSIQRVLVRNLEFTRMEFDIVLKQNWFGLSQFVMNFLGGKIQGDMQLSFDPMPRALKTAVHMTRLDTRRILDRFPDIKSKSGAWNVFGSNPYIDGTIHLDVDVASKDFSGGIEITSIGKEQMKMMLYYVDPYEKNENIADIRKALILGDVRNVSIPFNNGEIGMDVDVRLLGAPIPTPKLSRFPANQILENFVDLSKVNVTADDQGAVQTTPALQLSEPEVIEVTP